MISWAKLSRWLFLPPNLLSLARGVMGCIIPILMFQPSPQLHVLAFIIFVVAAISDFLDGYLARKFGMESAFGQIMGPVDG